MQLLCQALLKRPDDGLSDSMRGELHFYVAYVETRDGEFALRQLAMAEYWMRQPRAERGGDAEGWLERIGQIQQILLQRQAGQTEAAKGEQSGAGGGLSDGEGAGQAEAATAAMGQTFTLSLRPR